MNNFQGGTAPYLYEGTSENGFKLAMKVMQLDCFTESQFNASALCLILIY